MPTINIPIERLKNHPQNVRKSLGDLSELAESIKQKGIFQNLTVVKEERTEDFLVVIGNRRLAAARQAGLKSLPCVVVEMSEKDQVATMLLENMQRTDLTIFEQAQGFQQCLDLGIQEVELTKKTGLSRKTIKHRLELGKLDKELLKSKTSQQAFSLTSLYELEKVKDIKEREKIFRNSSSDIDLMIRIKNHLSEEREKENKTIIEYALSKAGIPNKKDVAEAHDYGDKVLIYKFFSPDNLLDVDETIKEMEAVKADDVYWKENYNRIEIYKICQQKESIAENEKRADLEQRRNKLNSLVSALRNKVKNLFEILKEGKITLSKDDKELQVAAFEAMLVCGISRHQKEYLEEIKNYPLLVKMLLVLQKEEKECNFFYSWDLEYHQGYKIQLTAIYSLLERIGLEIGEDERKLLDGTHELYTKEEE